ncbi:hypothetical protein CDL15_Pgr012263 [Punica granatum]|uniref:Uncharacterized protein n=1 Tax=Punica granatum TaxID=22663 RepID=A0A218WRP1_PUNGR|nr:hypothetical protein CDL15_Pgr012263 [Punica granatum]
MVTHLGAAPLNLKGMLSFCHDRPQRGDTSTLRLFPIKVKEESREEFSERREPMHHSSLVAGVSL